MCVVTDEAQEEVAVVVVLGVSQPAVPCIGTEERDAFFFLEKRRPYDEGNKATFGAY